MQDVEIPSQQKVEETKKYQGLRLAAERKYKEESEEILRTLKANMGRIENEAKNICERVEEAMRRLDA